MITSVKFLFTFQTKKKIFMIERVDQALRLLKRNLKIKGKKR